ncbi:hypothetical protein FUT48_00165 [Pseudomonas sp. JG-B]|nr:hypothetical protein [Pseudomonas sp. JG-B]
MDAPLRFEGDYQTAMLQLFDLYSKAERPLCAIGYAQNLVRVVEEKCEAKPKTEQK